MSDVFDTLVAQPEAAAALRHHARHPVHAYLVTAPAGVGAQDAIRALVAGLQCPEHGCGVCERCRRVLNDTDPDVYVAERSGVSWRVDELREAERVARRRPVGEGYQVVVIPDVELTTSGSAPSAPALLKTLEEPPTRTVFVLSATETPSDLATIVSRCIEVRLRALSESDILDALVRDGAPQARARLAAQAAGGDLQRARVLVRDDALSERIATWRAVPERLGGTPASAMALVGEITSALDAAMAPLVSMQESELATRHAEATRVGTKREVEAQFKREQRRFRLDELRFGLAALTRAYRDRLALALEDSSGRGRQRASAALAAIELIDAATRRLARNVDEALLLGDLMISLASL